MSHGPVAPRPHRGVGRLSARWITSPLRGGNAIVPVCFGGNFLTTGKRNRKTRAWSGLSLGVLGGIEGHILTPHPPPSPTKNPRHPSPGCMTGTAILLVPPGSNWEGRAGPTPTKHVTPDTPDFSQCPQCTSDSSEKQTSCPHRWVPSCSHSHQPGLSERQVLLFSP